MPITWADVTTAFPADTALAAVPVGTQAAILADVALEVVETNWPSVAKANRAAKYLAAHLATLYAATSGGSAPAGPITGKTVGQVSVTYAQPGGNFAATVADSTAYGREYRRLQRLSFGGPWLP